MGNEKGLDVHTYPVENVLRPHGPMSEESIGSDTLERLRSDWRDWTDPRYADSYTTPEERVRLLARFRSNLDNEIKLAWKALATETPIVVGDSLQWGDGPKYDISGPLRIEERPDGFYVLGDGHLLPCEDWTAAKASLARLLVRDDPPAPTDPAVMRVRALEAIRATWKTIVRNWAEAAFPSGETEISLDSAVEACLGRDRIMAFGGDPFAADWLRGLDWDGAKGVACEALAHYFDPGMHRLLDRVVGMKRKGDAEADEEDAEAPPTTS